MLLTIVAEFARRINAAKEPYQTCIETCPTRKIKRKKEKVVIFSNLHLIVYFSNAALIYKKKIKKQGLKNRIPYKKKNTEQKFLNKILV